jgi:hypothetical protein
VPDARSLRIESLRQQLAAAEAALAQAEPSAVPAAEEIAPEPEPSESLLQPEPESLYGVSQDPAEAIASTPDTGHEVGGYAGLGAAVSN